MEAKVSITYTAMGLEAEILGFVIQAMEDTKGNSNRGLDVFKIERNVDLTITGAKAEAPIAIATDGRRLHVSVIPIAYPEGTYKVLSKKLTGKTAGKMIVFQADDGKGDSRQFPDWKRVLPTDKVAKTIEVSNLDDKKHFQVQACKLIHALPEDRGFNFECLQDLSSTTWTAEFFADKDPVRFTCPHAIAVIMPLYLG